MSEIVNEAVIKVTADASGVEAGFRKVAEHVSGVEAGLQRVDETARKTGRTLDSLGSGPGLRNVGEGAGAAAGQMDRATKSMADSIQRATAQMSAGTKGTAEYYAALANARGVNVDALRPYLDRLDEVTRKTAAAAAAQRELEAGSNFLNGLRAQAEGIGKTASQMAALRAEQLGVADAARPLIEQLQAAEEAASSAGGSFSDFASALAAVGFAGGVGAIAQISDEYSKYIAQLKLATSGQSEFLNAQSAARRIATAAQSDLSATGALYASIAKSTRDLGMAQQQVADITETVSLALKVSGASGEEASSAILQLSQAFASGTLRGDEFNSVNEAAPRLMQAMADGLGAPVGALRKMAEEGELTTALLADALPRALKDLRKEAATVQTIAGSFAVLKNNVMEAVGATSQSSGVVTVFSGAIRLLADNLTLAAGAMATMGAVKLATMLNVAGKRALENVAANRALALSNLETARSNVAATAAASTLAAARVAELRAAVLATEGTVALAIATNGLIPAQARATAAASAHTAALAAQATAARATSVAGGLARGALGLLGGPLGAVVTLLGVAATAWAVWGDKAEQANDQVAKSTEESTAEMITRLDKQIEKLRERNALAATEPRIRALDGISEVDKDGLARAKKALDAVRVGTGEWADKSVTMRQLAEIDLAHEYETALKRVQEQQVEVRNAAARTRGERIDEWFAQNGTASQRMTAELSKLKKEFGAIPPEMEKLVRAKYVDGAATKAISNQARAAKEYADLLDRINGKSAGIDADFHDNLSSLFAGYKAGKQSLSEYVATVEKYIAQQPFAKQAEEDRLRAIKELSEFQDSYSKGLRATSSIYEKQIQDAEAEVLRNEELASTYGLTKAAVEELELARLSGQLAQRSSLGLTLDEIAALEKLIVSKKRSVEALRNIEVKEAAKTAAAEWKRAAESIEQSLTDALMRGFESGKGFGQNLADTIKNMFNTLVLRPIVSAVVNPVAGAVTGALGFGGTANAATGAGGSATSLVQSAMSAYKAMSTGFAGLSDAVAGGVQTAMSTAGYTPLASQGLATASGQALTPTASMAGTAAAYVGGAALGVYGGRAISNGYAIGGGSGNTAVNVGTAIGAVVAGPIGAAIGGAIGGLANRAFGMKAKEVTAAGIRGTLSDAGMTGEDYSSWKQKGGWFRSDKSGTDIKALSADLVTQFSQGFDVLKLASSSFASAIGVSVDSLASYSKMFDIALGQDQAANQKAISDFFTQVGDEMAYRLVPSLGQFSKSGETASATLQRLAGDFKATDAMAQMLGKSAAAVFGSTGIDSAKAREHLIDLAGGIDILTQQASAYSQNFLTEAERLKPVSEALANAMSGLGLSAVTSRAQFKQVIDSLNLTTDAGAKQYVAMMALAEAFALVHPATESATKDLSSYRSALADAYNSESEALKTTIARMGSFASSLRNLKDSALLGGLSPLSPQQKYAAARTQFETTLAAARGGDEKAQDRYQEVYTAFLEASRAVNASSSGYQKDFDYVQALTDEMATWAEGRVDVDQAQLDTLKAQVSGIIEVNKSVLSVRDALLALRAAEGENTAPLTRVAPPINTPIPYSSYGASNTTALVAEVKALRTEVSNLRTDQRQQTVDMIQAQFGAAEGSASRIAGGLKAAAYREQRVKPE